MLKTILTYLWDRRTTVLGYLQIILSVMVASTELFGPKTLQWLMLGNAILTAVLGHYNNSQIQKMKMGGYQGGFARPGLLMLLAILGAILASGCASFDARLKTAADIHTVTTSSVTHALDAHIITSRDAEAFQEIAVNSSYILDSALALKDTDIESAEAKLDLANKILVELHKYLLEKENE